MVSTGRRPLEPADVQALVGPQSQALADALARQPSTVGDLPSLCTGWTVRNVLAHVTMAARYDGPAFGAELAAAGYDFGTLSETIARRDGELPLDRLLSDLRSETMARWAPPGGGAAGALTHVVIHGLDITSAIGLPRTATDEAMAVVLDTLTTVEVLGQFGRTIDGLRLTATDLAWTCGEGTPVEAESADLVLALAGRPRPGVDLS